MRSHSPFPTGHVPAPSDRQLTRRVSAVTFIPITYAHCALVSFEPLSRVPAMDFLRYPVSAHQAMPTHSILTMSILSLFLCTNIPEPVVSHAFHYYQTDIVARVSRKNS